MMAATAGGAPVGSLAERVADPTTGEESGSEAEQRAGRDRDRQCEQQHRRIDANFRSADGEVLGETDEQTQRSRRQQQADDASGYREDHALREYLAHQPSTARAQGGAHDELAFEFEQAREEQVR